MLHKRAFQRAVGEGALAGSAAGAVLGLWHIRLGRDLGHNLTWLALERMLEPMAWLALVGVALSLSLAAISVLLRRILAEQRRGGAIAMAGLAVIAAVWVAMSSDSLFVLAERSQSPRLKVFAIGMVLGCGMLIFASRIFDLLQDADENIPHFQRRGLRLAALGTTALVLVWAALLAWPFLSSRRAADKPSVIILSMDTMRADRMGALGADPSRTPFLDELADEGLMFTQASATAPWTLPSHASLFTSQLPFDHHVRWSRSRLAHSQALLAEHFRNAGYRTGAFTGGGYVASVFGFSQGFQVYEEYDEIAVDGPEPIAASAYDWITAGGDKPFFVFLHTYEPHSPFFKDEFADSSDAGRLSEGVTFEEVDAIHAGEMVLSAAERRYVTGLYDSDVAHADRVMGGLLHRLRDEGRLDKTIVVVLSDHGEDLWDHSEERSPGHGHSLYQDLIHVPLLFRAPGLVPGGHQLKTPVSLLDVAPTLLAMAGLPPYHMHQGRSLEAALLSASEPAQVPVHAESVEYGPDRFMRRDGDLKVILSPTPNKFHHDVRLKVNPLEIFDLSLDPMEKSSAVETVPAARPMVHALRERARMMLFGDEDDEEGSELPPELEQQLRSLGYIQ